MTSYDTIQRRLRFYEFLKEHHRKSFALLRFMAGDMSPVSELAKQAAHKSGSPAKADNEPAQEWLYEVDTRDVLQFRSNDMLLAGKILSMATNSKRGELDFEGLDPDSAFIHKRWAEIRYGRRPRGCNGQDAERLAIWDAMVGGVGVVGLDLVDLPYLLSSGDPMTKPEIRHISARRCVWDITAPSISHSSWFACWDKCSGHEIDRRFGKGTIKKHFGSTTDDSSLDKAYAFWTYYDVDGEKGTCCVTFSTDDANGGTKDEYIMLEANPIYLEVDGYRQSVLPYRTLSYFSLPDVAYPLGLAELAVRDQLDRWTIQKRVQTAIQRSEYITLIDETVINPVDAERMQKGEFLKTIRVKPEKGKPMGEVFKTVGGVPDMSYLLALDQDAEKGIMEAFGYNGFALGSAPEGTNTATAAQAIVQRGDLTSGYMASRHVEFKADCAELMLAAGSIYDDAPLTIKADDVEYQFGFDRRDGPIGIYLNPGAEIVIRESSFMYQSRAETIQAAYRKMNGLVGIMANRPKAMDALITDVLEAEGIYNVAPYLEKPVIDPMAQPGAPGAAPV